MKDDYTYQFSLPHLYISLLKGWEKFFLNLRVKMYCNNVPRTHFIPTVLTDFEVNLIRFEIFSPTTQELHQTVQIGQASLRFKLHFDADVDTFPVG